MRHNALTKFRLMPIFKTIVKVLAIIVLAAVVIPFSFGFVAGFLNSIVVGYVVGFLIACVFIYATCRVTAAAIRRDHVSMENGGEVMSVRREN